MKARSATLAKFGSPAAAIDRQGFKAGNKQDVDDFERVVDVVNNQSASGRRKVHEVGMRDVNRLAVGRVNAKRPKWCCFGEFSYFLGGHG